MSLKLVDAVFLPYLAVDESVRINEHRVVCVSDKFFTKKNNIFTEIFCEKTGLYVPAELEDLYSNVLIKKNVNINKIKLLLLLIDLPADVIDIISEYTPTYTAHNASTNEIIYGSHDKLIIVNKVSFGVDHLLIADGQCKLVDLASMTIYYYNKNIFDFGRTLKCTVCRWIKKKKYDNRIFKLNRFVIQNYKHRESLI